MYCPECGSEEIEGAVECEHCHESFDEETLVDVTLIHPNEHGPGEDGEDTIRVCRDCYEDYYFGGTNYIFNLADAPVGELPKEGETFSVGPFTGVCIRSGIFPEWYVANFIMHVEDNDEDADI